MDELTTALDAASEYSPRTGCLELFSSAGGVPILFDKSGRRLPFPLIRIKPGLTGPDVMYISLRLSAIRQDIRLRAGRVTGPIAIPNSRGFDFDSGLGFVDAARALRLTAGF